MNIKLPTPTNEENNVLTEVSYARSHIESPALSLPKPKLTSTLLLITDVAVLALAAVLGSLLWSMINPIVQPEVFYRLWPVLVIFPISYVFLGLYPGVGIDPVYELRWLSYITTAVYLVVALALFLSKDLFVASRGIYLTSWMLSVLFVPLGRATLRHFFAAKPWWGVPVVVMGAGKTGQLIVERLHANLGLGLKVLACLDDDVSKHGQLSGVGVVGSLGEATRIAETYKIRHALIAMPGVEPKKLSKLIRQYASVFPHLIVVPDMFGMASVGIAAKDFAGIVGLHARQNLLLKRNRLTKRALDIALLFPTLVIALPIIALACIWIFLVSPGSPFYAQEREGYKGKSIRIWKLRTMYLNAEELLERHLAKNPEARAEWERFYKLKRDPRILPGAGFLRKTSIDELPQLFNILKGEMSFVGPRPFPYYHLESFHEEFRSLRIEAQPGITGLWQVSARSDGDLEIQEELDSYYIRNWSLWLDLYILARTPWAILFAKGAY